MLPVVKKRMLDHLSAAGQNITENDLRIWLYTHDKRNTKTQIQNVCGEIQAGFKKGQQPDTDEFEMNSGVDFPG